MASRTPRRLAAELTRIVPLSAVLLVLFVPMIPFHRASFAGEAPESTPPIHMTHEAIEARRQEQERLEKILAQKPGDLEMRIELAQVMVERRFLREAERQFKQVLEADPSRGDIWRRRAAVLREIGLVREEREPLAEALSCYQHMLALASRAPASGAGEGTGEGAGEGTASGGRGLTGEDLLAASGLALALGEVETAEALAKEVDPDARAAPIAELLAAAAAYKMGRLAEAAARTDQVRANLNAAMAAALDGWAVAEIQIEEGNSRPAPGRTELATLEPAAVAPGFVALAAADSRAAPAPAAGAAPEGFPAARRLQGYWKSQDPTPTTPINERYLEHCARVLIADALYSRPGLPGRDTDRGRTFIRYGSATKQKIDGADFSLSLTRRRGRYQDPEVKLVYPRITWTYDVGRQSLAFVFEDITFQGDFHYSNASAQQAVRVARDVPSLYIREVPGGLVRIAETQTCFLGSREDVIVSLAAAVPIKDLLGGTGDASAAGEAGDASDASGEAARSSWAEVEVRWAVFDPTWRIVAEQSMRLEAPECLYRDAQGRAVLLARAEFDLPAGNYIMATEFRDPVSGREGVVKREALIQPVEGLLSEIELVREVKRAPAGSGSGMPFVRYDVQVIPNPRHEIVSGNQLVFYYEIYRALPNAEGNRRCRILQRVRSLSEPKDKPPVYPLQFTFEIEEPMDRYGVFIPRVGGIDVSSLRPGRYELEVRVEDLVGGQTTERKVGFLKWS